MALKGKFNRQRMNEFSFSHNFIIFHIKKDFVLNKLFQEVFVSNRL